MLGRTMSLVTFASLGLVSISQAAAGTVARWDLDALFLFSGGLVLVTTAWSATRPGLRAFTDSLTAADSPHDKEPDIMTPQTATTPSSSNISRSGTATTPSSTTSASPSSRAESPGSSAPTAPASPPR